MSLKHRIRLLEKRAIPMDWLILECEVEPNQQQLESMQHAHNKGRTAILFGLRYDWAWMYGTQINKPWIS